MADLLIGQAEEGRTLIGVIGLFPGIGTTTTLLCLAARVAARGRKAIVVEGNFLAPRLAGWLDAEPTAWWEDVLVRQVPVTDAVIRAADENLDLLPLGSTTSEPLRLAGGLQASATAWSLREAYDLVLVDLVRFSIPIRSRSRWSWFGTCDLMRCWRWRAPRGPTRAIWRPWPSIWAAAGAISWGRLRIASLNRKRALNRKRWQNRKRWSVLRRGTTNSDLRPTSTPHVSRLLAIGCQAV